MLPPPASSSAEERFHYWKEQWQRFFALEDYDKALYACERAGDALEELIDSGQRRYRHERAVTRMNQGVTAHRLGDVPGAIAHYQVARAEFDALIAEGENKLKEHKASNHFNLAQAYDAVAAYDLAIGEFECALQQYDDLIANGDNQKLRQLRAQARMKFSNTLGSVRRYSEVCLQAEAAIKELLELHSLYQDNYELIANIADARQNMIEALVAKSDFAAARMQLESAIDSYLHLLELGYRPALERLAMARMNFGKLLMDLRELNPALEQLNWALDQYEELIANGRDDLRPSYANVLVALGYAKSLTGALADAEIYERKAIDEYRRLIPGNAPRLVRDYCGVLVNLANTVDERGRFAEAREFYVEAIRTLKSLKLDDSVELRITLARALFCFASNRKSDACIGEAMDLMQEVLTIYDSLVDAGIDIKEKYAKALINIGTLYAELGERTTAERHLILAVQSYKEIASKNIHFRRDKLALALDTLGDFYFEAEEFLRGAECFQAALNEYDALISAGRIDLGDRQARARLHLAYTLMHQGEFDAALRLRAITEAQYRQLIASGRTDLVANYAWTMEVSGIIFDHCGSLDAAIKCFSTAVETYRDLTKEKQPDLNHRLARALMYLGIAYNNSNHQSYCARHLHEACAIYKQAVTQGGNQSLEGFSCSLLWLRSIRLMGTELTPALESLHWFAARPELTTLSENELARTLDEAVTELIQQSDSSVRLQLFAAISRLIGGLRDLRGDPSRTSTDDPINRLWEDARRRLMEDVWYLSDVALLRAITLADYGARLRIAKEAQLTEEEHARFTQLRAEFEAADRLCEFKKDSLSLLANARQIWSSPDDNDIGLLSRKTDDANGEQQQARRQSLLENRAAALVAVRDFMQEHGLFFNYDAITEQLIAKPALARGQCLAYIINTELENAYDENASRTQHTCVCWFTETTSGWINADPLPQALGAMMKLQSVAHRGRGAVRTNAQWRIDEEADAMADLSALRRAWDTVDSVVKRIIDDLVGQTRCADFVLIPCGEVAGLPWQSAGRDLSVRLALFPAQGEAMASTFAATSTESHGKDVANVVWSEEHLDDPRDWLPFAKLEERLCKSFGFEAADSAAAIERFSPLGLLSIATHAGTVDGQKALLAGKRRPPMHGRELAHVKAHSFLFNVCVGAGLELRGREPFGLIQVLAEPRSRFAVAPLLPITDFYASILTGLFLYNHFNGGMQRRDAFLQALDQFACGHWTEGQHRLIGDVLEEWLIQGDFFHKSHAILSSITHQKVLERTCAVLGHLLPQNEVYAIADAAHRSEIDAAALAAKAKDYVLSTIAKPPATTEEVFARTVFARCWQVYG